MSTEMTEEEFQFLLHEANRQIEEHDKEVERVRYENYQSFLSDEEIPPFREAVEYMNMYNELKKRRGSEGIQCHITNRKAIASKVAIKRHLENENGIDEKPKQDAHQKTTKKL